MTRKTVKFLSEDVRQEVIDTIIEMCLTIYEDSPSEAVDFAMEVITEGYKHKGLYNLSDNQLIKRYDEEMGFSYMSKQEIDSMIGQENSMYELYQKALLEREIYRSLRR